MRIRDILYQKLIEKEMIKYQLKSTLREEFKDFEIDPSLNKKFAIDLLGHLAIARRVDIPTLVGMFGGYFSEEKDPYQACADELEKFINLGYATWDGNRVITNYLLSDDVIQKLELYQYPIPLVIKPKKVKANNQTGYWLVDKGSIILKDNFTDDDICLDHINRMNQIPLSINTKVLASCKNKWKKLDIIKKKDESIKEHKERLAQFDKFNTTSRAIMDFLVEDGNVFYITHKYDKRGRTYTQGYHVQPQGTDYQKAVIEFANKEYIEE